MAEFITNKNMRGLYDTVQHKYPDLGRLEEEFEDAFALYKKEFPKNPTPQVYTIISEFSIGTFTIGKEIIGIGLDLFLGPNYRYYPSVGVPAFLLPKLDKPYILPNAMQVLAAELTTEPVENNTLLAQMIYHGKTLYFAERVLPDTPEERIIGYSKEQLKWCKDNEPQIWGYFIEKQLLYSTRMTDFPKYVEEGPTTTGMPTDAPGKVGAWTGWQIVRAYMENNPDVTLAQLMEDTDNKKIFERSGYKPRKG